MMILPMFAAAIVSAASWNGIPVAEQTCRVSAIPFNRVWPGYQRSKDQTKLSRFVSFDVEKPGVFVWTLPAGAKSARIRPFRRDQGVVKDGSLEVSVSRPEQFVIESGGEELHVFADAPWRYEPRLGDRYFGPGEHDAGAIIPKSGERIVLDRDAVVYGNFVMTGVTNVTIEGRGILDGSRILREDPNWPGTRHLVNCGIPGVWTVWGTAPVYANRCQGISLSGIVFRDAPRWTMNIIDSRDIVIDGVKLVGMWRYNSDGIDICACENSIIRNSFIRSFDDCVISRPQIGAHEETEMKNMTVSNCVLWCDWGCNMKVQHGQRPVMMSGFRFRDIDCVNVDSTAITVTTRWGSSDSRIRDVAFDDIRIDAPAGQFRHELQRTDDHVFSRKVKDTVALADVSAYSLGKPAPNQGKPGKMDPNFFKFDYRDLAFRDFRVYDRPGHLLDDSSTITPKLTLKTVVPRHTISNVILSGLPAKTKITQCGNVTGVINRCSSVSEVGAELLPQLAQSPYVFASVPNEFAGQPDYRTVTFAVKGADLPDYGRAAALVLTVRATDENTRAMEIGLHDSKGGVWGSTTLPIHNGWCDVTLPFDEMQYFSHWHLPPVAEGTLPQAKLIKSIHFCFGKWLCRDSLSKAHGFEVKSVRIVKLPPESLAPPRDRSLSEFKVLPEEPDDTERFRRAVRAARGHVLDVPAGTYRVSSTICVDNSCSIRLHKSATVVATAEMPFVFELIGNGSGRVPPHDYNRFFCGGRIDGAGLASCVRVTGYYHFTMRDTTFLNGKLYGLRVDGGYELIANNLYFKCVIPGLAGNSALYVNGSDSHYTDCVVVDYTIGVNEVRGGANRFTRCHVWGGPLPPVKPGEDREMLKDSVCYRIRGGSTILRDCYADTGKIGFELHGWDTRLLGCSYFNNKMFKMDDVVIVCQKGGGRVLVSECAFSKNMPHTKVYEGNGSIVWKNMLYNGFGPDDDCPGTLILP